MDAQTYFLMLHEEAHTRGKVVRVFGVPTPDQWRATLPGHNSIAWNVWHIARGEDWGVTVLRGDEQLLVRDGWDRRMGVTRRDIGTGMTTAEVAELSAAINLEALHGYWDAVYSETRRFVRQAGFDSLAKPLDAATRRRALDLLRAADGALPDFGPASPLPDSWVNGYPFLNVMALMDVYYHLDEADHMVRMLLPDRRFT
jgi:hypothetical protein